MAGSTFPLILGFPSVAFCWWLKAAFHYSSKLQTWLQTWSQTCVSVSQAGRKQVASQLQTCFKPGDFYSHVCDLETRPVFRNMEDTDAIVVAYSTGLVVWSLSNQVYCRFIGAATMLAAKKKRKHSTCVKQYITDRHRYNAYSTMFPEMKANDMSRYVQ